MTPQEALEYLAKNAATVVTISELDKFNQAIQAIVKVINPPAPTAGPEMTTAPQAAG
jgi:hypothetical protein